MEKIVTLSDIYINEIWNEKPKSRLVRYLMGKEKLLSETVSRLLGTTKSYFDNKLHRNSFSLEDILLIAKYCGYDMYLESPTDKILIDLNAFDGLTDKMKIRIEMLKKRKEELELELRAIENDILKGEIE